MSVPKKLGINKELNLCEKQNLLKDFENGMRNCELSTKYGIAKSTVTKIIKNKDLYNDCKIINSNMKRLRRLTPLMNINDMVYEYVKKCNDQRLPITGPLLQGFAQKLAEESNIKDFKASNGWLNRFRERYNIKFWTHQTSPTKTSVHLNWTGFTPVDINDGDSSVDENPVKESDITSEEIDDVIEDIDDVPNIDNEKLEDNALISKLRNDREKLRRECKRLREENSILRNELMKNGVKLETIRGLRRVPKSRESRTVKVALHDDRSDGVKHISALVEFEEYENETVETKMDNFDGSVNDDAKNDMIEGQSLEKKTMNLHTDEHLHAIDDEELKKRYRKISKLLSKQLLYNKSKSDNDDANDGTELDSSLKKKKPRPKKYLCTWPGCDKRFYSTFHRDSHERVHTNDRPFKCPFEGCDYSARNKETLSVHERRHTGALPYQCPYENCDFRSRQNANLKTHILQHTGEKPLKCDWPGCDRQFAVKSSWQYHKKLHTNDKAFACQYPGCVRKFICRKDLKNHEAVHTGERKHKCSWPGCDRSFIQKTNLNNHLLKHANVRPFPCDWPGCEWRSLTKHALMKHKKIHTGERPFPCPRCDRRFADESTLKDHIRVVHDKVRRYVCEWENCGRTFTVRRLLNEHQMKEGHILMPT